MATPRITCQGYPLSLNIHAISFSHIHLIGKSILRIAVCSLVTTRNLHLYRYGDGNGDSNGDGNAQGSVGILQFLIQPEFTGARTVPLQCPYSARTVPVWFLQ